jgi:phytoene synthase
MSYAYCERLARREAGNFYHAFRVLPTVQRRAMCALYAFMRVADDLADGPGETSVKRLALKQWRADLHAALSGDYRHQIYPSLHHVIGHFAVPVAYLEDVLDGVEMDLEPIRFADFDALYRYCYRVASAVGLACIHIWGFSGEKAKVHAEQAGVALQLTNILRDLPEDLAAGRVYLPVQDLRHYGCHPEQLMRGPGDPAVRELMRFEVARARGYYAAAEGLSSHLRPPGRAVFQVILRTYRGLLDEIERRGYDVFRVRVSLSRWRKLGLVLQALPVRWEWVR